MPVTLWPRSRRERTLAARCLRLADALRTTVAERDRLRDALRVVQDGQCDYRLDPDAGHRLLHEQARIMVAQQQEIGELHAVIARLRPSLMPRDTR